MSTPFPVTRRTFFGHCAVWIAGANGLATGSLAAIKDPPLRTRRVWLRLLLDSVEENIRSGQKLSEQERFLAGLTQVRFLYLDEENKDLILEGPAEDRWQVREDGSVVGESSRQPVLQLDDLAVAWRNANDGSKPPSVSLDHRAESVQAVQEVIRTTPRPRTPADRVEYTKKLQQVWGPQDAVTGGVPTRTRFNKVMVDADWEMKRISLGLSDAGVKKMPSYIDLEFDDWRRQVIADPENAGTPSGGSRFWFFPAYTDFATTSNKDAVEIPPNPVQLLTESHFENVAAGKEILAEPSAGAKKFVEAFTENYSKIAEAKPLFAELRNLFDWVAVARLIRMLDVPRRIGWDLGFLRSEHPVADLPVPATMPGQVAVRQAVVKSKNNAAYNLVRPARGGVSIDVGPSVNHSRFRVEPPLNSRLRSILAARPERLGLWWQDG